MNTWHTPLHPLLSLQSLLSFWWMDGFWTVLTRSKSTPTYRFRLLLYFLVQIVKTLKIIKIFLIIHPLIKLYWPLQRSTSHKNCRLRFPLTTNLHVELVSTNYEQERVLFPCTSLLVYPMSENCLSSHSSVFYFL